MSVSKGKEKTQKKSIIKFFFLFLLGPYLASFPIDIIIDLSQVVEVILLNSGRRHFINKLVVTYKRLHIWKVIKKKERQIIEG